MSNIVYFETDMKRPSVIRFVSDYRKKNWLRKEKVEYTDFVPKAKEFFKDVPDTLWDRIMGEFPQAKISVQSPEAFYDECMYHAFYAIAKFDKKGEYDGYYCNGGKDKEWTGEIEDAELWLSRDGAASFCESLRRETGERIAVKVIFLNVVNGLMEPNFIITCKGKRNGLTKFYSRLEQGNRIRLVKTSAYAKAMSYDDAVALFERLKADNKNFYYSVIPLPEHTVGWQEIESYMEKTAPMTVEVTTKLKWIRFNG